MKLAKKYLGIHEGGLVKIPVGLQKAVIGGAKHVIMGQVISTVNEVIRQYTMVLNSIDSKHPNYKDFDSIVKTLEKYVTSFKIYKPRKSNVRKKKIAIKSADMKPYDTKDFSILLTTGTSGKKGGRGSITTIAGKDGFYDELPLMVNFGRIGRSIDIFKSLGGKGAILHTMMRDNKPLDTMALKMLKDVFPEFKKFVKDIRDEMEDSVSVLKHELTHVVQQQTGQGYSHKDLNSEGGYIELKGKSKDAYDKYAVGSKEIKAYLTNQVDAFYRKNKTTIDHNKAVKEFLSDRLWFQVFKDEKKRNKIKRDFVIALSKDRRFGKNKKLAEKYLSLE